MSNWLEFDNRIVLSIYVALLLFSLTIAGIMLLTHANEVTEKIKLEGEMSAYSDYNDVRERAIGNGEHIYNKKVVWNPEFTNQTFESQYMLNPAVRNMWNQYYIGVNKKDIGWQHELRAYNLSGPFIGMSTVTYNDKNLDTLYQMQGAGDLTGRVVSGESGKPEWVTETFGKGNFSIESHINISKLKPPNLDWLEFCDKIELPPELRWNATKP